MLSDHFGVSGDTRSVSQPAIASTPATEKHNSRFMFWLQEVNSSKQAEYYCNILAHASISDYYL